MATLRGFHDDRSQPAKTEQWSQHIGSILSFCNSPHTRVHAVLPPNTQQRPCLSVVPVARWRKFKMATDIEKRNMELMQTLDDAWNAQDLDIFRARHKPNVIVRWPGKVEPTIGIED